MTTSDAFKALYDTVARLRAPDGCEWDREQTPSTLRGALIEETYECLEAIDNNDPAHINEELGDLYLLATMISFMHEEENKFSVADVLTKVNEKLIRRHPHVFGDVKVKDTAEILDNWEAIKIEQEGRKPKDSLLDEVSAALPPMERSFKLQKKAAKVGFDWQDTEGVIEKIKEEFEEVKIAINSKKSSHGGTEAQSFNKLYKSLDQAIEEELGDLLFSVINLCRFLKVEPSAALRRTNSKFIDRFKYVEKKMKEAGHQMKKENLCIMEKYWNEAKEI
ncbi:MAG: nucleoside triphosphate pyrophosphohydrolase [Treponema sp.]|nr:nucleoside triphosphate pyrophosphohydrolase [Treponema sp.]